MDIVTIHFFVEEYRDGQWHHMPGEFYRSDSGYTAAFAWLIGLRNQMDIRPIRPPRQLPKSDFRSRLSPEVFGAYQATATDTTKATWYTLEDIFHEDWAGFARDWCETDFSVDTIARLKQLSDGKDPRHFRVVLWYDEPAGDDFWPAQLVAAQHLQE